ncbi:MAG: hypothetical protein KDD92_05585 [Caldilineaceae bacterium]|nr:hypothetical protein [Caldilineaceae bacterium]
MTEHENEHETLQPDPRADSQADDAVQPASPWSRRRFLRRAAAGAMSLTLAACGRRNPPASPLTTPGNSPLPASPLGTPFRTGRHVYMPLVRNQADGADAFAVAGSEPTLTPTPPSPTDTPSPEATATPRPPTATPTPQATPFPPGPASKLGLFVARNHPQVIEVLAAGGAAVIKTLELDRNFAREMKQAAPTATLIGRIDLPQLQLADFDPMAEARRFVETLLPIADDSVRRETFDGWESYNEPVAGDAEQMKRLADFEAERTRLLGDRGIRSVVGNFGTGQPHLELWPDFLPAVQAVQQYNGWLGLHEYSAPTIYYNSSRADQGRYPGVSPTDEGWLTLRYRKVYNQYLKPAGLAVPLIFTELGVDGLVANRPGPLDARGWQDFQRYWADNGYGLWGPGAYIEQLAWYDEAMRQDDYVVGGAVYAMAASSGWESYDILGPAGAVLQQYLGVHAQQ